VKKLKISCDVIVLTKNSQSTLERCIQSIERNVPINKLIVIDGGSTDKTLEIAKQHTEHVVQNINGNRSTARQLGIRLVDTEWFVFVDSDVVLCHKWFEIVSKYINPTIGAISGIEYLPFIKKLFSLFEMASVYLTSVRGIALTQNGLIRTDAIRDINIPNDLHWFEDYYILKHIRNKGYKYVITKNAYGMHFRPEKWWGISGILKDSKDSRFWKYTDVWLAELFHGIVCIINLAFSTHTRGA